MIAKWLEQLAGFIVEAAFAKLGITNLDDLLGKTAAAFRAELADDLGKIDELPLLINAQLGTVMSQLVQQVAAMPGQVAAQVIGKLPDFGALISQAIRDLNPFR